MEGLLAEAPGSPEGAPWGELVEEQVFFVKKVVPSWGVEGVGVAEDGGEGDGVAMMKPGGGMETAVACEAVEFEDLFANPIAQGANLEFRVSRVMGEGAGDGGGGGGGGASGAMDVDGAMFERFARGDIVMEDALEEVAYVEVEEGVKEELVGSDVKVEVSEGDGKLMQSFEVVNEEIKLEDESDAAVAMSHLETQSQLLNSHVEELQRIVTLQCRLTGANPLAQELVRILFISDVSSDVSVDCNL